MVEVPVSLWIVFVILAIIGWVHIVNWLEKKVSSRIIKKYQDEIQNTRD